MDNQANQSAQASQVPAQEKKRPPRRRPKKKSDEQKHDLTSTKKFLQISKLIRAFKPVTINGSPTQTIIDQIKLKESNDPDYFKTKYKNHARLSNLQKYLAEFIESQPDSTIYISMCVKPSDPDFPFDLDKLQLNLSIPGKYPDKVQKPKIVVLNDEIPRGFAINVENGFKRIAEIALNKGEDEEIELIQGTGLLSMILTLDKYLEEFLKQEKRETFKFVKTVKKSSPKPKDASPVPAPAPTPSPKEDKKHSPAVKRQEQIIVSPEVARLRDSLTEELINKLGDYIKVFKKSHQGETLYKIALPIFNLDSPVIPNLWKLNEQVELMVAIPINFPQSKLKLTFPNNFNSNLILKYCQQDEQQFELVQITKQYRKIEQNFTNNFNKFDFGTNSLVSIFNWLTNNIGQFSLSDQEFKQWVSNIEKFNL
ncbi:uncharacterized protein SPAPADRAFT_58966 [Spathaspora passalidarum NRRL Y-27907]|uniref:Uncharacterized protein n=1 Tax=Spathaspora passalidarum (strain NRRL Y-27907 / 11-Y1) TaxID=619300 RepID=G3AET7_SPAPN|nr:uncharacterized protein SPAPADRAFT_58966 [Spathaspora passalidarum NRRL Y-27907]EGW35767.1 hypothetical protein SPAPADRAFT_58966 [Spathaspora passalidarum NRRL Y-27907]